MAIISLLIVGLLIIYAVYKYKTTEDLPKKWQKIKFESQMLWIGISQSTTDLFYKNIDKVELFQQPHKVAVITGGSQGIGLAVVKKLLECRIVVVIGARDPQRCQESVEKNVERSLWKERVFYEKCDVGDMESTRNFARSVGKKFSSINILINNAGILSVPYIITKDGFVSQMAVNYLGHFLLSHLLMPQLLVGSSEGENSRIVNTGSCVHKAGQIRFNDFDYKNYYRAGMAYADSKLAQIMATKHMGKICKDNGWNVQVHAAHPGVVATDIFKKSIMGPLSKLPISRHWYKTPEAGSRTIIHAAISRDLEGKTGNYLGNCRIMETQKSANNLEECQRLFNFTCDLLKIKCFGEEVF